MSSSGAIHSDRDASSQAMLLPATLSERESHLAIIAAMTARDALDGPSVQLSLPTTNRLLPEELALLLPNRNQYVGGPLALAGRAVNPTWNASALAANLPRFVPNNVYYTNNNGINGGTSFRRNYPYIVVDHALNLGNSSMLGLAGYGNEALLRRAHQSFPIPNSYSPLHPLPTTIQDLQRANHLTSLLQPVQGACSMVNNQAGRHQSGNDPIITTPYNRATRPLADWGGDVLTGTSNFPLPAMPHQISTRSLLRRPPPVEEQRGQFQLPAVLSRPSDDRQLSRLQAFLRQHIEAFQATEEDMLHVRGRTKKLRIGQVGIRCRHCALVQNRGKGSVYFPTSVWGFYQASQNMCMSHFVPNGSCPLLPNQAYETFVDLTSKKAEPSRAHSTVGRAYWATTAQQLGLIDMEDGVYLIGHIPMGVPIGVSHCNDGRQGVYRAPRQRKRKKQRMT